MPFGDVGNVATRGAFVPVSFARQKPPTPTTSRHQKKKTRILQHAFFFDDNVDAPKHVSSVILCWSPSTIAGATCHDELRVGGGWLPGIDSSGTLHHSMASESVRRLNLCRSHVCCSPPAHAQLCTRLVVKRYVVCFPQVDFLLAPCSSTTHTKRTSTFSGFRSCFHSTLFQEIGLLEPRQPDQSRTHRPF